MRIFFVTNNYTPYSGGVASSITASVNALQGQGHDVFIITLNFLGKKHNDPEYIIRIACPIKFMYKKNYMAIPWRPTHAINTLIKKYNPDIIHIHHPFLLGVSALHAAHKHKIPCVFTYHTLYEKYAHYVPFPQICTLPIIRTAVRRFCNKVDAIIAPSTYVKHYLESQNIERPITIIPSALQDWYQTTHKQHINKQSQFFELLLVTRFVPEKNIPFLFEVMKLLPETFRLTLVGYGSDYEKLHALAMHSFKLSPHRIRFVRKPEQEYFLELYRTSYLFVFPSITDTQGIVLAESMSQGLPVIALDGPGQRDIIDNGINGFIVKNTQEMAEKILDLAHNPEKLKLLQQGARITAHHYKTSSIVKKLLALYYSI
jgi:1,2-diacylglycerol 3-alpha-glucosyltransferase